MNKLLIIDSNYICYVHRFALSAGLSYKGGRTEIIYGFLKSMLDMAERFETRSFAFAWDSRYSKRREIYPEYKMQRKEGREEMSEEDQEQEQIAFAQFNQLRKEVLPAIGFNNVFRKKGYESDDIIASIVYNECGKRKCIVVSGDEDMFQLLDNCSIYNIRKHETMTGKMFRRIYKITPPQWINVKQLGGCSSDNVKGIPGIGQGRALSFVRGELKGKYLDIIRDDKYKTFLRNYPLVKLPFDGTGKFHIEKDSFLRSDFKAVCREYGLKSFLKEDNLNRWERIFNMI